MSLNALKQTSSTSLYSLLCCLLAKKDSVSGGDSKGTADDGGVRERKKKLRTDARRTNVNFKGTCLNPVLSDQRIKPQTMSRAKQMQLREDAGSLLMLQIKEEWDTDFVK